MLAAIAPLTQFFDLDGSPLDGGYIWVGPANLNPETTSVPAYWDPDGQIPAAQPIRTLNGYTVRNGQVAMLYIDGSFSLTVRNRRRLLVAYLPITTGATTSVDFAQFRSDFNGYKADVAGEGGSQLVGYQRMQDGTQVPVDGTELLPLQLKMKDVPISLQEFGAVGDWDYLTETGTDNYAAMQKWMDAMVDEERDGFIPPGNFGTPNNTILKPIGHYCPNIRGVSGTASRITGPTDRPALKIKGISGRDAQAVIRDVTFETKNGTAYGVEVADQCGVSFIDVGFGKSQWGLLLHNEDGFTEYVIADRCVFTEETHTAIAYKRTNGTDSFHGSGLTRYKINEKVGETECKVIIGGGLSIGGVALPYSDNIIVYNAPLDGQCWKNTAVPFIANNSQRFNTDFHGTLTFESFFGQQFDIAVGGPIYQLGSLMDVSNVARRGSLMFAETYASRSNGSSSTHLKPYRVPAWLPPSGVNTIAVFGTAIGGETYRVVVELVGGYGSSPKKLYVLNVYIGANGFTGVANTQWEGKPYFELNGGDMPYPTFAMLGNALRMDAPFAGTVFTSVSVSQIGFSSLNAI